MVDIHDIFYFPWKQPMDGISDIHLFWKSGLYDYRIVHDEPIRQRSIQGKPLITSSAWRNDRGAATRGIGILLGNKASKALKSVRSHTSRILVVNFHGNPATSILVIYSPTNVSDEDTIESFYDSLRRAIESIPAHNAMMVIGDFNARIGKSDAKFAFHDLAMIGSLLFMPEGRGLQLPFNCFPIAFQLIFSCFSISFSFSSPLPSGQSVTPITYLYLHPRHLQAVAAGVHFLFNFGPPPIDSHHFFSGFSRTALVLLYFKMY